MNANLLPRTVSPLKLHFFINFDFAFHQKFASWYFYKKDGRIVGNLAFFGPVSSPLFYLPMTFPLPSNLFPFCFSSLCRLSTFLFRLFTFLQYLVIVFSFG